MLTLTSLQTATECFLAKTSIRRWRKRVSHPLVGN
jgi:hypothetical protein